LRGAVVRGGRPWVLPVASIMDKYGQGPPHVHTLSCDKEKINHSRAELLGLIP
jgi:hypothetical protein